MLTAFVLVPVAPFGGIHPLRLGAGTFIVGRSSRCNLVVRELSISRQHARVDVSEQGIVVTDLGSQNGTFVDDQKVAKKRLTVGQQLRFGNVAFALEAADEERKVELEGSTAICKPGTSTAAVRAAKGRLSPAQMRVLGHLLHGLPEKQIASRLRISPHTVHNHVRAVYRAFRVHSRAALLTLHLRRDVPRSASGY